MNTEERKTILLVEDEPIVSAVETAMLEKHGFLVISASSGEHALEIFFENHNIDLVLMDINLGEGIDGTETAERILAARNLPLIFLSSHTEQEIVQKTERITSYGYIVKNTGEVVLIASIKMAFRLYDAQKKEQEKDQALRSSEAIVRSISQHFTAGMIYQVIVGQGGERKFTFLSDSVKELYGVTPEEGMRDAKLIYEKIHPEDIDRLKKTELLAMKNMKMFRQECRMRNAKGEERWSSFVSTPKKLEDGSVCFDGLEFIITGRKRAEKALKEREMLFMLLFEDSPSGIALFDEKGVLKKANKQLGELFGEASEKFVGNTLESLSSRFGLDGRKYMESFVERLNGNQPVKELNFTNRKGERITVTVQSSVLRYKGTIIGVLYQFNDITERKAKEEEYRIDKETFEIIFNTSPDAVMISRLDNGAILSINEGFTELTGFSAEDVIGKTSTSLNIWNNIKDRDEMTGLLLKNGKCENKTYVFCTKNGEERIGMISAKIIDIRGTAHLISVTRDITDQR